MSMEIINVKQANEALHVTKEGPTIVCTFKVIFTGEFSTLEIYQNASEFGLPWEGDYVTGSSAEIYCSAAEATIAEGSAFVGTIQQPSTFVYVATFSTITPERYDLSPLSRPPVVRGGGLELTEVRNVDTQGNPLVNSVGDYYENLPNFYVPGSEFTISWNVADNPATLAQQFSFSTNQSDIWGQEAFAGIIRKITYEPVEETYQGVLLNFWRITVPITFRNDGQGWNFQPFDYGYRYLNGSTVQNYIDPVTQVYGPVFLDGSGGLLNGNGTTNGSPAVIFPAASGSSPPGYETLTVQDWTGLNFPVNPFA